MNSERRSPQADLVEAALAARLALALHDRAAALPHDLAERLRAGRVQALDRLGQVRTRPQAARAARWIGAGPVLAAGGASGPGGRSGWWERLGPLLPLVVLLVGLQWVSESTLRQQARATAEIDAVLLTDELPPAAYADPGFAEFLRSTEP